MENPVFINPKSDERLIAVLLDLDRIEISNVQNFFLIQELQGLVLFNNIEVKNKDCKRSLASALVLAILDRGCGVAEVKPIPVVKNEIGPEASNSSNENKEAEQNMQRESETLPAEQIMETHAETSAYQEMQHEKSDYQAGIEGLPEPVQATLLQGLADGKRPTLSQFNAMSDREQRLCLYAALTLNH